MALYRQKITLGNGHVVPFADASHDFKFHIGLSHFLAERFDGIIPVSEKDEVLFGEDLRHRFTPLLRDFYWYNENLAVKSSESSSACFEASMQYIFHKDKFVLALKGGNNDEPHNHNDLGGFIIYTGNGFVIDDLGWPDYDNMYFSDRRYENICASSLGHSVPIINEKEQIAGGDIKARIINASDNSVELDLSDAYNSKCIRRFTVEDDRVIIFDTFQSGAAATERLVTRIKPETANGQIKIGNALIEVSGADFAGVSSTTFRPRINICKCDMKETETVYLIDFTVSEPEKGVTVCIKIN